MLIAQFTELLSNKLAKSVRPPSYPRMSYINFYSELMWHCELTIQIIVDILSFSITLLQLTGLY